MPSGSYSGAASLLYTIEIHSVLSGTEIGQALYRWRTSETAIGGWEAANVLTHTTVEALNYDVAICFTAGTGADFAVGDTFQLVTFPFWSLDHLFDWRPDTIFATTATASKIIAIDCGQVQQVRAFLLAGHTTDPTATIVLEGNTTSNFTSPLYQIVLTPTDPLILYLDRSYQYWQIRNTDATAVSWIIRSCYLGDYLECPYNAQKGATLKTSIATREVRSTINLPYTVALSRQAEYALSYNSLTDDDLAWFQNLFAGQYDLTTGLITPCWFHFHSDNLNTLKMMRWSPDFEQGRNGLNSNTLSITLQEVS
jgi:hypothetical protein